MGFESDKRRGKVGERYVADYFSSLGYEVRDTSEMGEYQSADVDFLLADGIRYEVKTDYMFAKTGNLALEDSVTNAHGTFDSWLWTSEADFFVFVNPKQPHRFACISSSDLRHLVRAEGFRKVKKDDGYKIISLYLLPFEDYRDCFEILD